MDNVIRIGTRDSQLAVWQATLVKQLLAEQDINAEIVFVKSEGDLDLITPLYDMGVQGIFTKTLDIALLNNKIDIAVHSMKDVPTSLPEGIVKAAVLQRASYKDLFIFSDKSSISNWNLDNSEIVHYDIPGTIATSSIRRKAQWLHRYPQHHIENLRGNVNTRLKKVYENPWDGAIFAAAGLDRINLRPTNAVELNWMLPAPAQGAIIIVCRRNDSFSLEMCSRFNDHNTDLCTKIERDFLHTLQGGCSTPVSALAEIINGTIYFKANLCSTDGKHLINIDTKKPLDQINAIDLGINEAFKLLQDPFAVEILNQIKNDK